MKIIFSLILLLAFSAQYSFAQVLPESSVILSNMVLANKYFMDKWPDPSVDIVTNKTRPSNLWTRATYYEGLMGLYFVSQDANYYQYAYDWADSHDWLPTYGSLTTRDGDHQCCGQTYIELYLLDPKPEKIASIKTNIDNMMLSKQIDDWSWIDAVQMSMPVFAKLGSALNDDTYYNGMWEMYNYTKTSHGTSGLYNQEDGLWWRDKDFDPPYTTPNGKSCYWSRGNGWVYTALVRVLDVLPKTETHYQDYLTTYLEMSEALIACQRTDGFWNSSLVDPEDYGGKETSGTAFFVYGLAWGINNGLLESDTYKPAVINGWNGLQNDALHTDGFLGWVQGTGKQPSDAQPLSFDKEPNFEDFGLGAFLLAGSETYKMAVALEAVGIDGNELELAKVSVQKGHRSGQQIIRLSVSQNEKITMQIVDVYGRIRSHLINDEEYSLGDYQFSLVDNYLQSGIYFVRTQIGKQVVVTKVVM